MKQKDLSLILFIIGLSAIVSFIVSSKLISTPKNRQQQVEVVEKISSEFVTPDKKYFNDKALDPTQTIEIGNDSNEKPFGSR
jgi:hypothetical protein